MGRKQLENEDVLLAYISRITVLFCLWKFLYAPWLCPWISVMKNTSSYYFKVYVHCLHVVKAYAPVFNPYTLQHIGAITVHFS